MHPDLSEGRLAKLRAAVVNARALAEVARTIDLGRPDQAGPRRGEHRRPRQGLDPLRHGRGGDRRRPHQRRHRGLLPGRAPAVRPAHRGGLGARRGARLEDLAPGARGRPGPRRPRVRHRGRRPRPHEDLHRPGPRRRPDARQRRRPLEEGGRAGRRRDGVPRDRGRARHHRRRRGHAAVRRPSPSSPTSPSRPVPELPEVEVVRAGLARHVLGSTITRVEVLHPRPVRRDPRGPEGFAAALVGRADHRRPAPGQVLLAAARQRRRAARSPRHERADARAAHRRPAGAAPAGPARARPAARDIRFADQRMFGGLPVSAGGAELPPEIAHIARDPLDPEFDDDEFVGRVRRAPPASSGSCSTRA